MGLKGHEAELFDEELGAGATSLVVLRRDKNGVAQAVKKLLPKYRSDSRFQEALRREFQILEKARHPLIVSPLGLLQGEDEFGDCGYLLAMAAVDGWSLREIFAWAEQLEPSFRRAWGEKLYFQLRVVIKHLESLQVIHGDLCPENILVARDGFIRLIDFGSARDLSSPQGSSMDAGHPPFTASHDRFVLGADRFSVGRILEFWLGHSTAEEHKAWIQELCESRQWPAQSDNTESLRALPIFPFLGQLDARDHRIPRTLIQKKSWSFAWPKVSVLARSALLILSTIFLTSFSPRVTFSFISFPLVEVQVRQGEFSYTSFGVLDRLPLRSGEIHLSVQSPHGSEPLTKTLHLQSGREYKIFEDFQDLDKLQRWTNASSKM